jgi:UDP-N-acetylmuramoyl-L-alanyl-D-glutamate--2,6-diaminopimelate ligase
MKLKEILSKIKVLDSCNLDENIQISDIEYDSRLVKNGQLFFAIKGENDDGNLFIDEAVNKGAAAIVVSNYFYNLAKNGKNVQYEKILNSLIKIKKCFVVVDDTVDSVSKASAFFYDYPSNKLSLIGVTGTNGKTSTTFMMESVFKSAGFSPAVIGTIMYRYADKDINEIEYTTPKSLYLQRLMQEMLKEKVSHVAMEVSSHGVELGRVSDLDFETCVFTNLSRDHMDFHKTMDNYFDAKKKLFTDILARSRRKNKTAIINIDCEYGKKLVDFVKLINDVKLFTYGFDKNSDLKIKTYKLNDHGSEFTLSIKDKNFDFDIPLIGLHNILNASACIAVAMLVYDIPYENLKHALSNEAVIPGRLERVAKGFNVFVDYAHTDDALSNVLISLKNSFPHKKIITVFGCGGDRDKGKRPKMGKAVSDFSDYAIVTSDNPRFEEPEKIIESIVAGMRPNSYEIVKDRKDAIKKAIEMMNKDTDIILIAGKGHEKYQTIKGIKTYFDDKELAKSFLQQ